MDRLSYRITKLVYEPNEDTEIRIKKLFLFLRDVLLNTKKKPSMIEAKEADDG